MIEIESGGPVAEESGDALVVPVMADLAWGPGADWVAEELGDWLTDYLEEIEFEGKAGTVASVPVRDQLQWKRVILVGLGSEIDAEAVRQAAGRAGKQAKRDRVVATTLHQVDVEGAAGAAAEGFLLAQYRFDKYQSEKKPSKTEVLRFLGERAEEAAAGSTRARIVAEAVNLARDLINEPPGHKPPERIVDIAAELAKENGLSLTVYRPDQFEEERFGGLAGVSAGSQTPAAMLVLRWEPPNADKLLALVGKGIIFDSGGLSLKTAAGMETMKTDMSGAVVVIAAINAVARLQLPIRVVAAAPLTENMPGGAAQRPGDVLHMRNGKTVEVLNTDAEGRLVMADALSLLGEEEPDLMVDAATLTGACLVALGDKIAGLFGSDDEAADQVIRAAARAGEDVWRLPMPGFYRKNIDSEVADIKNTGSRWGGTINAALFLKEFVGDTPWVHLDIAGPARWPDDEHYHTKGGSGFGVRTLVALAEQMVQDG
jgi:leucyl aminopeptidase